MSWGLERISAQELAEWRVFEKLEPFGSQWENILTAMLASLIANSSRDPKIRSEPFGLEDFMLIKDPDQEEKKETALQQLKQRMG